MEPPLHNDSEQRLSWEHAPARRLIALGWPITLSGLSFALMGLVDTLFVAKLGASELAGVGLGVVVTNGVMGFGFGVLRGVKMLLAQGRGSGAQERTRVYVGAGVLVGLWLGLAALLLGELAAWIVPRFAATPEAGAAARAYIAVRSLGAPIIVGFVSLREARYGQGDTRSTLVSSVLGNLVHAGFDALFLLGLGWGAAGAAFANVLGFIVQLSVLIYAQREDGIGFGEEEWDAQLAVVRAGAFTGLHWALEIGALAFLSLILAGIGDREMAAHQMGIQLSVFSFLPALAIAEAASVLSAEAVGKGRLGVVHQVAKAARRVALAYSAFCALVLVAGSELIAAAMTADKALQVTARGVFWAVGTYLMLESITVAGHGVLRGVGAQRFSALCALSCAWLCTPALGILFTRSLGLGAPSGFMARACEMALTSTLVWRHLDRDDWREVAQRSRRLLLKEGHAEA